MPITRNQKAWSLLSVIAGVAILVLFNIRHMPSIPELIEEFDPNNYPGSITHSDLHPTNAQLIVEDLNKEINVSSWNTYKSDIRGYSFMYPEGWEISPYTGTSPKSDMIAVENPKEVGPHEDGAFSSPYSIFLSDVRTSPRAIYPMSANSTPEDLGESLTGLPSKYFVAKWHMFGRNRALLVYDTLGNHRDIRAYFFGTRIAYRISLDSGFINGYSPEDLLTFVGLCSSFTIVDKEPAVKH